MTQQEFFTRYTYNTRTDKLGGGAFGTVYKAYDNVLDKYVAIKISEVKTIGGKEFSLMDEFNAIKGLSDHTNIAKYEQLFSFDQPNGVFDFAIIQYYPDGNLKDLIKNKKLTQTEKENIAKQILEGLSFLHHHKVVHRDMKPSNILIHKREGKNYIPKIADFGLSKKADPNAKSRFTNSFGGGTLEYSSPEQLRGQNLRFNTDLWAWAVIVYELFTEKPLFQPKNNNTASAENEKEIFEQILNKDIISLLKDIPNNWSNALLACLDRNPETRVKTAGEIQNILNGTSSFTEPIETPKTEQTAVMPAYNPTITVQEKTQIIEDKPSITKTPSSTSSFFKKNKKPILIGCGSLIALPILIFVVLFMIGLFATPDEETNTRPVVYQDNNLYGYKLGDSISITPQFTNAEPFENNQAKVSRNDSIFLINPQGQILSFEGLCTSIADTQTPKTTDIKAVERNPIDLKKNKSDIKKSQIEINSNENPKIIISISKLKEIYKEVWLSGSGNNGVFSVQSSDTNKWGVINKYGDILIPLIYDFNINLNQKMIGVACKNNVRGIIDKNNKILVPFEYSDLSQSIYPELFQARKNNKCGYVNVLAKNKEVIPIIYKGAYHTANGIFQCELESGEIHLFDKNGNRK